MVDAVNDVEAAKLNGAEETTKNIVSIIQSNILSRVPSAIVLACYIAVSFLTAISLFSYALKHSVALEGLMDLLLLAACAILLIGLFFLLLGRWRHDLPKAFLLVAAPSAMVFGLLILPDQVPDEIWHIYRVLNFTESGNGSMVAPDALMYLQTPTTYPEMYEAILEPGDWAHTHIVDRDMSSYLSHLYTVPGVAAAVGKLLNLNVFVVVYMARFANIALFLAAGYVVLRLMPFGKVMTFVYLLNPMLVQQESSCNADAFVNVAVLLFIAYCLKLHYQVEPKRPGQIVILAILLIFTCISKYAYAPLALLLLLFVSEIPSKRKRTIIYIVVALVVALVIFGVVLLYNGETYKYEIELVRSPIEFIKVFLNTVYQMGPFWVESFAGYNLGALSINAWLPCFWAYGIVLALSLVVNLGETAEFKKGEKAFISVLVLAIVIAITLVFRTWSGTHDGRWDIIMGVQGRYFIPVVILLLLSAMSLKRIVRSDTCVFTYATVIAVIFVLDALTIIRSF